MTSGARICKEKKAEHEDHAYPKYSIRDERSSEVVTEPHGLECGNR